MKRIFKGIAFFGILLVILIGLSRIFEPKNNNKEAGMLQTSANAYITEKKDTIDVLTIGDSESYSAISPLEIYQEYGYTGYVCGTPKQLLCQSYDYLKDSLKNQKPKVVLLETNAIYRDIKPSKYLSYQVTKLLPIIKYHNRWKSLTNKDFTNKVNYTWNYDLKGYIYNTNTMSSKKKNHMKKKKESKNISKINKYYLNKIINTCNDNNIKLILISTPSTKNWNYTKHNGVKLFAKENNLQYIDLNLNNVTKIDWKKDSRDAGDHLNYNGAKKVSKYLGQYLNSLNILEDHRQDSYYSKWNDNLKYYNKLCKK